MFESVDLPSDLDGRRQWAQTMSACYETKTTETFLTEMVTTALPGQVTLVSSFGTDSAVLLHLLSRIDQNIPVQFLDTKRHFGETLRYRDQLVQHLGLSNVTTLFPKADLLTEKDPEDMLFHTDNNLCCYIRKVEPLERALSGYDAWISGRKRHQALTREDLPLVELESNGRIKLNPLAAWTHEDIENYFTDFALPHHPLEEDGYLSIGCMPCTDRVKPGEDRRAGRWKGLSKTECGIHMPISMGENI